MLLMCHKKITRLRWHRVGLLSGSSIPKLVQGSPYCWQLCSTWQNHSLLEQKKIFKQRRADRKTLHGVYMKFHLTFWSRHGQNYQDCAEQHRQASDDTHSHWRVVIMSLNWTFGLSLLNAASFCLYASIAGRHVTKPHSESWRHYILSRVCYMHFVCYITILAFLASEFWEVFMLECKD